jgi:hypothetical protein
LFNTIGYTDNESSGGRIRPDFTLESQRFRVQLRKTKFLYSQDDNRTFESLGSEYLLSEQLKNFSNLACERRITFINDFFANDKTSLPRPIPITIQEAEAAASEENMTKSELLTVINSLLSSMNSSDRPKYRGLQQKTRNELRIILQNIKELQGESEDKEGEAEAEREAEAEAEN